MWGIGKQKDEVEIELSAEQVQALAELEMADVETDHCEIEVVHACNCPACRVGLMAVDETIGRIAERHGRFGEVRASEVPAAIEIIQRQIAEWRGVVDPGSKKQGVVRRMIKDIVIIRLDAIIVALGEGECKIDTLKAVGRNACTT